MYNLSSYQISKINFDASLVTLANYHRERGYSVSVFLSAYTDSTYTRNSLIQHMFSLGLTTIGIDNWELDWK